jgi:hypothetical protein
MTKSNVRISVWQLLSTPTCSKRVPPRGVNGNDSRVDQYTLCQALTVLWYVRKACCASVVARDCAAIVTVVCIVGLAGFEGSTCTCDQHFI